MISKKLILSILVIAVVIGGLIYGAVAHHKICIECLRLKSLNPDVIRHYIQGFGPWAIGIYVLLYTLNTFTLIPPIAFMSLSAGAIFGPIWGTIVLATGAFCGTSATFIISRYLGGPLVEKFVKGKAADFNEKLSKNGFVVLLPIRLIGFPPYEFVNYACGLSKIPYKDYISATMIGMSPAIIIQVLLADRVTKFNPKDPVLWIAILAFIAMIVITGKIVKNKQTKEAAVKEDKH